MEYTVSKDVIKWLLLLIAAPFIFIFITTFVRAFLINFKLMITKGINKKTIVEAYQRSVSLPERVASSVSDESLLDKQIAELNRITKNIDESLNKVKKDIEIRKAALSDLRESHAKLSEAEEKLKKKVKTLSETRIEVAEYFKEISESAINQGHKKSHIMSAIYFAMGVVSSIIITMIFK